MGQSILSFMDYKSFTALAGGGLTPVIIQEFAMNTDKTIVHVDLSERTYDIEIAAGNLSGAGRFVRSRCDAQYAIVITDEHVEFPHAEAVGNSLLESDMDVDILIAEAGEPSKSVTVAETMWENLVDLGTDRKTIVLAVGGGVIGDLAGFVAATFARGLSFFQVPTTLLAQVDSSVGGKVGINLPGGKNMVGAFWQPRGVLIDTDVLRTLPDREYRAGLAEVVKYGVILDPEFFAYLENSLDGLKQRAPDVMRYIVARSCELKAAVVQQDERETTGHRAILNFGHTFCHAIETVSGYDQLLHGEGVSIGMVCAARLAGAMERVDDSFVSRLRDLLVQLELPVDVPDLDHDKLLAAMQRDKKAEHGQLRFVLPTRIGNVELVPDVPPELARKALSV